MGQFQRRPGHSLLPSKGTGGSTIKRGAGALNNYMYYGDYEEGEFYAEDLSFNDEKKKESQASKRSPSEIISRSNHSQFKPAESNLDVKSKQGLDGKVKYQRRPYKR